jgi:hypothetical protein
VSGSVSGSPALDDLAVEMAGEADLFVFIAHQYGANDWLDFTAESVRRIDLLIDSWWPPNPAANAYESMVPAIGAYIGCVLCRDTGAVWVMDADRHEPAVEIPERGRAFPLSRVRKRCQFGIEYAVTPFFDEVRNYWLHGEGPATAQPPAGRRPWPFGR